MSRPQHHTPALRRFLVSALYHQAQLDGVRMTCMVNGIVEQALQRTEGWRRAELALQEQPPAYRVK